MDYMLQNEDLECSHRVENRHACSLRKELNLLYNFYQCSTQNSLEKR